MRWSQITVRLPDVMLSCLDSGTPGPCVVLVHGLAGHAAEWDRTAEVLAARCRVIAFDQRGHGQSSRRPADLSREAFVRDVVAVIDRLGSGEPVSLVGQSIGAHTAMLTAAAYPHLVDRLVMVEGGVGGGDPAVVGRLGAWLRSWPVPFPDRGTATAWFVGRGMSVAAALAWAAGLEDRGGELWPRFDQEVMEITLGFVAQRQCWSEWVGTSQPVLLVFGERSLIDPAEVMEMVDARPAVTAVCVPRASHDLHLDQVDAWISVLQDFLGLELERPT